MAFSERYDDDDDMCVGVGVYLGLLLIGLSNRPAYVQCCTRHDLCLQRSHNILPNISLILFMNTIWETRFPYH